ncbi:hypothetical protein [Rhodonellum sp.]|uniref:hypothetical protein n=1 Tax=Rhodonellum sp. TaxID=2231180 RepID=UPI002723B00E|nr:hypothetical protein [Rhodonellum sp.]MDO9553439.1 hypothetical protein [Rhodonellum sp.]
MKGSDIQYLEVKLAERPFRFEELYFEILDHILCKYEVSGFEDVVIFWEEEKSNWSRWKIYKLRFKIHLWVIWKFIQTYFRSVFSTQSLDLRLNLLFLSVSMGLGFNFYQNDILISAIVFSLWILFPIVFESWMYHKGNTLGENSKLLNSKRYVSVKRDALHTCSLGHLVFWQFILTQGKKALELEGFFGFASYHPLITSTIIFLMLVSARAFFRVYDSQLKPFLYEVK